MIQRGESYFSSAYKSQSPIRDFGKWPMILGDYASDYYCGNIGQQLRRAGLDVMRYSRPFLTGDQFTITQFGHPSASVVADYWNNVLETDLDDGTAGAYCHTSDPLSSSNRVNFIMSSYTLNRPRFAQANWLEFVFGADASGIRSTDGEKGDIFTRVLWERRLKTLFHDNFAISTYTGYSGSNEQELKYASMGAYETRMFEYLTAFKERVRSPLRLKLAINLGLTCTYPGQSGGGGGTKPFGDFVDADLFDILYREGIFSASTPWWNPAQPYPWLTYMLIELVRYRMVYAAGKSIMGDAAMFNLEKFAFYYPGSASPRTYLFNAVTKTLTVTLGTNVFNYTITTSSTWSDIKTFLEGCYDPSSIYLVVTDEFNSVVNWSGLSPYDCFTTNIGSTTISTASGSPSYLRVSQTPRETLVTGAAVFLLAAPSSANKTYLIGTTLTGAFYDSDLFDAFALLGEPDFDNQPLTTTDLNGNVFQASWDQVDPGWGHVYYRLYTNGVVFLNWTDTDRTVNANNSLWGSRSAWYPMAQKVGGQHNVFVHPTDIRTETSTNVTIRAKSGEVCLFEV